MNTRSLSALAFVALCLALGGLALHRQIAAHPLPPEAEQEGERIPSAAQGQEVDKHTWHIATGAERRAVTDSIQSQLDGFRTGNATQAMKYQSEGLRHRFSSPQSFLQMIQSHYPEFGHCRTARFGPVWTDHSGQYANVIVTVRGEDGFLAQGDYLLVREAEGYRVAGVNGGGRVPG